jgi:GAG-pre-integrase domain
MTVRVVYICSHVHCESDDIYSIVFSDELVANIPSLSSKLLSVGQISDDLNCIVLMYPHFCLFQDAHTKKILGRGTRKGKLYVMEDISEGRTYHVQSRENNFFQIMKWHKRLGHPSFGYMKKIIPDIFEKCNHESFDCTTCIKAKNHRVSFQRNDNRSIEPFALIHSDVWGPSPVKTLNGNRFFIIFIDDCTRMTWLYLLKTKGEVVSIIKSFCDLIKNQYGREIRVFRSDNRGEFQNRELKGFF